MEASDVVRRRCTVAAEPNRDGGVTLYGVDGRAYQAIDASEGVCERLRELGRGDTVTAVLEPVRCRGDGWRIVRLDGVTSRGHPLERTPSSSTDGGVDGPEP
ncbi:hypothetical protein EXE42_03895 [Halorubrum sp. SP3]|uniref:hypothetical protein n=1 Tax=Halorubrum sp. SP3 TaxID=1537265 RepID=UPI0010F8FFD9|nr:hypothetical protein [Halorubrum sp. SP3]TKX55615.1 hypothetical protein EXE42_03895 [Halorubrum sp. SP3]